MIRALRVFCLLGAPFALAGLGCAGDINGGDGTQYPDPSNPGNPAVPNTTGPAAVPGAGSLSDKASIPGETRVRRLTNLEYDNTLRDLLGVTGSVSADLQFPNDSDPNNSGFVKGIALSVGDDARVMLAAGAQIGDLAMTKLATLLPCSPIPTAAPEQDACVTKFIETFAKRAYRRPVTAKETELLHALYTKQRSPEVGNSFEKAVSALVAGIIQSPQFLYHWELGSNAPTMDGNLVRFNSWEMASRLSYAFWSTMPDQKLFAAAEANALSTPEQIAQQAQRLLDDDRAKVGLANFHLQWMEIGQLTKTPKDDTVKNFSPEVAQSMLNETRDFVASIFLGPKAPGTLEALLTSVDTVVDANVAKIYGVNVTGNAPQPVSLNKAQRGGILTQTAFLTAQADTGESHPVKRGDKVLSRLLCVELKVPPDLKIPAVAEAMPGGQTTRQRFETHQAPQCATCHAMLDPVGFAFEAYDTVGAYRTTDQGKPVVTTGQVTVGGDTLSFKDAIDLSAQIAKLPKAQDCVARQWMHYMLGRREVAGEQPSVDVINDLFKKSGFDLRKLLVGMTRTRSFTHRSVSAGEVTQ